MVAGAGAGPLILIVEDDDAVAELYQLILVGDGFRVARAANGAEGLLLEEELAPDLLLLDLHMPMMNGLELLRRRDPTLRARTPVIVSSGDAGCEGAALAAGAALFLPKLVDSGELLAAIDLTLRRADADADGRRRRAGELVAAHIRQDARREQITARLDPNAPELRARIGRLVRWLAGYYEMGIAWVDVLHRGGVLVEAAALRRTAPPGYDAIHRDLVSAKIADARSPFLVGDLQAAPWLGTHPAARSGYRFFAGVPLRGPDHVGLGALCIADSQPRAFDAANLTVLQHCGTEFGFRIAQLAGVAVSGPFLFDGASLFSAETMNVLVGAELLRAHRRRAAFELALVRIDSGDSDELAHYAEHAQRAIDGRGCAAAGYAPSIFALLVRGHDRHDTRARMDTALAALRRDPLGDVAAVGVVAHAGGPRPTATAAAVLDAAQALLVTIPADEWLRRAQLPGGDAAGADATP